MQTSPSRPQNPPDGSTAVKETDCSRGDPQAAGAPPRTDRSVGSPGRAGGGGGGGGGEGGGAAGGGGEPCGYRTDASPGGVQQPPPKLRISRGYSSGYNSGSDSLPSSPRPLTADKATQTPSLSSQAMTHAGQRLAEEGGAGGGEGAGGGGGGGGGGQPGTVPLQHGHSPDVSSAQRRNSARDPRAVKVGRELRQYGDELNGSMQRRHLEPVVLLCVSLLLLVVGRMMYLQGGATSPGGSQV